MDPNTKTQMLMSIALEHSKLINNFLLNLNNFVCLNKYIQWSLITPIRCNFVSRSFDNLKVRGFDYPYLGQESATKSIVSNLDAIKFMFTSMQYEWTEKLNKVRPDSWRELPRSVANVDTVLLPAIIWPLSFILKFEFIFTIS